MPSLVVVGAQWGDEGKGKIVDYLTTNADWVVRFQGGNNAGHTLVVDGVTTKLSLVPSGILRSNTRCLIGAGTVVNPEVLMNEIEGLRQAGVAVDPSRLVIDQDAHLILNYHCQLDKAREEGLKSNKIGTTGRGIGPAYEDRAKRCGVRFVELLDLKTLKVRVEERVRESSLLLEHLYQSDEKIDFAAIWSTVEKTREEFGKFIGNGGKLISEALRDGKKVLFEGAQGTLLDQTYGTVPFVTSSHTVSGAACTGVGIGPKCIDEVVGVVKAYTTRVGEGPFPSELHDEIGKAIAKSGVEFGTVTGRQRRCGWFDAVAMKKTVRLNGLDSLAITKLDVLSGLDTIKICKSYLVDGKETDEFPVLMDVLSNAVPQYVELEGWKEDISQMKSWEELPKAARTYIDTLSEMLNCPVSILSVGPERDATIYFKNASENINKFL